MKTVHSYLTFNGNCRQAMLFYQKCLGGKIIFQTVGDLPLSEKMPAKMKNSILHSTLTNDKLVLMGSDIAGEKGLLKGNAVSLLLNCSSEKEIKDSYKKLLKGGIEMHSLENTFWGALFGGLTDRFGNHWLLHFDKNGKKK